MFGLPDYLLIPVVVIAVLIVLGLAFGRVTKRWVPIKQ